MENHHGFIGNTNLHSWLWNWPAIVMLVFWRVTFNSNQNHGHMVDGPKSSVICSDASKKGLEKFPPRHFSWIIDSRSGWANFIASGKSQKPNPPRSAVQNSQMLGLVYSWNPNDLSFWRSTPQNKAFSKQNKRHLGSRFTVTFWWISIVNIIAMPGQIVVGLMTLVASSNFSCNFSGTSCYTSGVQVNDNLAQNRPTWMFGLDFQL